MKLSKKDIKMFFYVEFFLLLCVLSIVLIKSIWFMASIFILCIIFGYFEERVVGKPDYRYEIVDPEK